MKQLKTFSQFISETKINEGIITDSQMEMAGKKLINKIGKGAKFYGELRDNMKHTSNDVILTVVGFGGRANAFQIFEVENEEGEKLYLKVTVMNGASYKLMSNLHGNWDDASGLILDKIEV